MGIMTELTRCSWAGEDPLYQAYHDKEWGVPERDDRALFELLMLEGFQAGLSWLTILRKRENFRAVFDGFQPATIARYGPQKIENLLADPGIVRHRGKIEATIAGAKAWLEIMDEPGGFTGFVWDTVDGAPILNAWPEMAQVPAATEESKALSRRLKARGFNFCGPTICYAFMQAAGLAQDHVTSCFRYRDLA
jgi:DNA-3-methyladenine glycosylase I